METKVPVAEYSAWKVKFYSSGDSRHLRLGQGFLNHFLPRVTDPKLFYATDPLIAEHRISAVYLNFESGDKQ